MNKQTRREITAALLRAGRRDLATWAARNLVTSQVDEAYFKTLMPSVKSALKSYGKVVKTGATWFTIMADDGRSFEFQFEPPAWHRTPRGEPKFEKAGWVLTQKDGTRILAWGGGDLTGDKSADLKAIVDKAKATKWR